MSPTGECRRALPPLFGVLAALLEGRPIGPFGRCRCAHQIASGFLIAPLGHSATHVPQPLQ